MFWGMNLKPNRKYSQTIAKSFHISQAALDPESADDSVHKMYISGDDNQKYLICTLRKNVCEQVQLDLNFAAGDPICFQTIGSGNVSLSGYLVVPGYFDGGEEEEEEDEEDEEAMSSLKALLNGKKADAGQKKKNKKKGKSGEESDEEDESLNAALEETDDDDDEDEDAEVEEGDEDDSDNDDDEEEDDDDDDDEEEDDDDEEEDEEVKEPKKKIAKIEKKDNKQQQQQQNGAQKSKKEKKAEKQQEKQQQPKGQQQQQKTGEERTLTGGVKVQDVRVGNGEEVKQGKRAHVYYEGRLKSNNKVFDSLKNGAPFKFTIGRGEVIKAWDVGVAGMKVGGKRRIVCPPHMAYGSRGSPPTIPPNSTLVFEVELKSISK